MKLCPSCGTLNPDGENRCLACEAGLDSAGDGAATRVEEVGSGAPARCPQGHPIDPTWSNCPYCARQSSGGRPEGGVTRVEDSTGKSPNSGGSRRKTRLETAPGEGAARRTRLADEEATVSSTPRKSPRSPRTTRLEESGSAPVGQRQTVLRPAPGAPASTEPRGPAIPPVPRPEAPASSRRLVAAVAAPGLRPGGVVFAVREGKNRIGAGAHNEIRLQEDGQVSADHAILLSRRGTFHLADLMSTNGTAVNGEELTGTHSVELRDRDRIRCGATELVLLTVESDEGVQEPAGDGSIPAAPFRDESPVDSD